MYIWDDICTSAFFHFTSTTVSPPLLLQVLQLYQITQLHHGLMMVGPSGSGKSCAWKVLLKALERLEGVEGVSHIIDPKVSCTLHMHRHTHSLRAMAFCIA